MPKDVSSSTIRARRRCGRRGCCAIWSSFSQQCPFFITPTPQTEIGALPFGSLGSNAPFQGDGDQQAFDAGGSDHLSQTTYVAFWHLADIDADDEHVCFWG
jgi:hypothetical protein